MSHSNYIFVLYSAPSTRPSALVTWHFLSQYGRKTNGFATSVHAKMAAGSLSLPFIWHGNLYADNPAWQPPHLHHFPSRLYAFVFRLWDQRPVDVIARFLKTTPENVTALALDLGLPPQTSSMSELTTRYSFSAIFRSGISFRRRRLSTSWE